MKRLAFLIVTLACLALQSRAQSSRPSAVALKPYCDSLETVLHQRTGVRIDFDLKRILKRGSEYDFYFTKELGDYPWRPGDLKWFRNELEHLSGSNVGAIFAHRMNIAELPVPIGGNSGSPLAYRRAFKAPSPSYCVTRKDARRFNRGLDGRNIALWQSHGRYYNEDYSRWMWQRAVLHRTVEDVYTQSYVLPFLIPMLENAGAYVMTPRERDIQTAEYIADNDASSTDRTVGTYEDNGSWDTFGAGFCDFKQTYFLEDNPFRAGTSRVAKCTGRGGSWAKWTIPVEKRGEYAVYVSFQTLDRSSECAEYVVRHLGGATTFVVNQQRGSSTWMYLGTFEFGPDTPARVELSNKGKAGDVVCADAVRLGGGMGKIDRGTGISGLPSYLEGALYSMPWYGIDTTVTKGWEKDYTRDYASRGSWVRYLSREKNIPFDLSLAFHTDAGIAPADSIIGTLAVYSLYYDRSRKFSDGNDRIVSRLFADRVQTQIVDDVRKQFEPAWTRRQTWDRSYSESRTTDVPSILLELLSHQNFADMRLGLDPSFRFTVSRAVYKGILKTLSDFYQIPYTVQPLPVSDFSVSFAGDDKAFLNWKAVRDTLEPTASPTGFVVYTRVDDGAFDSGREVSSSSIVMPIEKGHVYSYKVVAFNDGGYSFPSEVLSVALASPQAPKILVVNDFTRVSAPFWACGDDFALFDGNLDGGVPYMSDISYMGEMYEYRRALQWKSDNAPGFGASYQDNNARPVAGNTFDFVYRHVRQLLSLGYSSCSTSVAALSENSIVGVDCMDILCGKQVTTMLGRGAYPARYQVFPKNLRDVVTTFASFGGGVIISGADIASDLWAPIYPQAVDSAYVAQSRGFVSSVLGYTWESDHGSRKGLVTGLDGEPMSFYHEPNPDCYQVECPDAIVPVNDCGHTVLTYPDTDLSAAVFYQGRCGACDYRVVAFGFPLETLCSSEDFSRVLSDALSFLL